METGPLIVHPCTRQRESTWDFEIGMLALKPNHPALPGPSNFSLVWLEEGSVSLQLEHGARSIAGPGLICMGPRSRVPIIGGSTASLVLASFLPEVLNQAFASHDPYFIGTLDDTALRDRFVLEPFLAAAPEDLCFLDCDALVLQRIRQLFGQLEAQLTLQADEYWPCRSRTFLIELLFLVRSLHDQRQVANVQNPVVKPHAQIMDAVARYLQTNCHRTLNIAGISREFALNRTSLMRDFKAQFGSTITHYLTDIRIRRASMMLRDTALPISEVVERSGLGTPAHFSRTFRRVMNCSATEYRLRYRTWEA